MHSRRTPGVRVAVVDATRIGSEALSARLRKDHCDVVYAGTAADQALIEAARTDVALISATIEGDPKKGYDLSRRLRQAKADLQVVIMVDRSGAESVVQAFRSGARGIFGRDGSLDLVSKCINRVHQGQVWANSEELQHLLEALVAPPRMRLVDSTGTPMLAPREQEVVHWVAEGLSNREIAARLGLSENTVKNYLFRIFDKLGISNRVELILYATSQLGVAGGARTPLVARSQDEHTDNSIEAQALRESLATGAVPQFVVADMYRSGRGVPANPATALAWYIVAEEVAQEFAVRSQQARETLERELTPKEVAAAKRNASTIVTKQSRVLKLASIKE